MTKPEQNRVRVPSNTEISEATIQRMLSLQESRVALELKQADIQIKELDHNQKLADKSIDAQSSDRKDERAVNKTIRLHQLLFAAFIVAVIVAVTVFALYLGKEAMVLDIVKVLCGFAGGFGVSSYFRSRSKDAE